MKGIIIKVYFPMLNIWLKKNVDIVIDTLKEIYTWVITMTPIQGG